MVSPPEVQFQYLQQVQFNGNPGARNIHLTLYIVADIPIFHSKIENQVILSSTHFCVNHAM